MALRSLPLWIAAFVLVAGCGGASVERPTGADPASPSDARSDPSPPNLAAHPASLPPGYGHSTMQPPSADDCQTCRYQRVLIESAAGQDRVLLCAREPKSPIKPFDYTGTLLRASVLACDPRCCP